MTVTDYLKTFIGRPYIWGGDGTGVKYGGFDCSGLVLEGLWAFGLYDGPDVTAQGLYNRLKDSWLPVDPTEASEGDLLFFGSSVKKITHVAMSLGGGLMIEAGGGGRTSTTGSNSRGFVRIRPLSIRKNVVGALGR